MSPMPRSPLSDNTMPHQPVMRDEALAYLNVRPGGRYIDCTTGAGGHSAAILEASAPDGRLLANDADPAALAVARARLAGYGDRVRFAEGYFDEITSSAGAAGIIPADGRAAGTWASRACSSTRPSGASPSGRPAPWTCACRRRRI